MPARATTNSSSPWFECLSKSQAPSLRLFCFPYAGGNAELFRSWLQWFPDCVEICLVHLPGRGRRINEEPFTRLGPLINVLADNVLLQTHVPYAFFGHSMGALIAFELARELFRRDTSGPERLFLAGRYAPQWLRSEPPTFNLPHEAFLARLKSLKGTPQEVLDYPELMQYFTKLLRADFETVDTYEYQSGQKLTCPITVYGGLQDERIPVESCHAWQQETIAECNVRMLKGNHFFIRDPQSQFIGVFRNDILKAVPARPDKTLQRNGFVGFQD
jgi:medium-chain acyl-[acyl-carrier-protein] hydrolase